MNDNKLIIAITSSALFDIRESNQIFTDQGKDYYRDYQIENEHVPFAKGTSFNFVMKLLELNKINNMVEVVLLSRNSSDTGLRVLNSIEHYNLGISRAVFTKGRSPYNYLNSFNADLFLSANSNDVKAALVSGYAAATIWPDMYNDQSKKQLRIAFDGDAVLFSDESERIYQEHGLEKFNKNEVANADNPLSPGPFKSFFIKLAGIQAQFCNLDDNDMPIRTLLITARSMPAHTRVIKTIRSWGVGVDEAIFLAGAKKGSFLKSFGADIYFDDQKKQCESAKGSTSVGHVPSGVLNSD
jgi:5'-nucleotidase